MEGFLRLHHGWEVPNAIHCHDEQPEARVLEHKRKLVPGFTRKYHLDRWCIFETFGGVQTAIQREKPIQGWLRAKKVALIVAAIQRGVLSQGRVGTW